MTLQAPEDHLSDNQKRYLMLAIENIERLAALARTVEDFPSARDFEFHMFDLRDVLIEAIAKVSPFLEERNVRWQQDWNNEPMKTIGDRAKIAQGLGGFITAVANAVQPGTGLTVSAAEADGLITVRITAGNIDCSHDFEPDISLPSRLWKSHAGSTSAYHTETQYSLTCELPVIRL